MPLYLYECRECGKQQDIVHSIKEMEVDRFCACSGHLYRVICPTHLVMDYAPYQCPITGETIEGRRAHKENLKRHDCRLLEPGEVEDHKKTQTIEDKELDHKVGETVGRLIHDLPQHKREKLNQEMQSNPEISIERG